MVLAGSGLEAQLVGAAEHAAVLGERPQSRCDSNEFRRALCLGIHFAGKSGAPSLYQFKPIVRRGSFNRLQKLCASYERTGPSVHCDGVQAAGRIALNINELDVDSFALAAHKFGGVPGVGALLLTRRLSPNFARWWTAIRLTTWYAPGCRSNELDSSPESMDSRT